MASKASLPQNKEDEVGRKWDRCLTDLLLKLGGGVIIGGVVSYIFCHRKKWPIALASGFAVGMAYCNCERDLNLTVAPTCSPHTSTTTTPTPNANANPNPPASNNKSKQ